MHSQYPPSCACSQMTAYPVCSPRRSTLRSSQRLTGLAVVGEALAGGVLRGLHYPKGRLPAARGADRHQEANQPSPSCGFHGNRNHRGHRRAKQCRQPLAAIYSRRRGSVPAGRGRTGSSRRASTVVRDKSCAARVCRGEWSDMSHAHLPGDGVAGTTEVRVRLPELQRTHGRGRNIRGRPRAAARARTRGCTGPGRAAWTWHLRFGPAARVPNPCELPSRAQAARASHAWLAWLAHGSTMAASRHPDRTLHPHGTSRARCGEAGSCPAPAPRATHQSKLHTSQHASVLILRARRGSAHAG